MNFQTMCVWKLENFASFLTFQVPAFIFTYKFLSRDERNSLDFSHALRDAPGLLSRAERASHAMRDNPSLQGFSRDERYL